MNVANKSLLRRIGALTVPGILVVVALVLVIISLVVEERGTGPDVRAAKNWVLLAASVVGIYAIVANLGRGGLRSAPARVGISLALFAVLFYASLQELQNRRYSLLNMSAATVQMLILLLLVAPLVARGLKVGVADVTPVNVLSRVR
jgi:hypothetical protein